MNSTSWESFWRELRHGLRSLGRAKGLTATVVVTLALGIGANAAMFSLVRGILLRPLVNRDEARLIYLRQSAPGNQEGNANFSIPEILDLRSGVKSFEGLGEFSSLGFELVGLGQPRSVQAGVVNGSYFRVMGLRPVLGRLLNEKDDGPGAQGAVVLTYRFWSTVLNSDPHVLGKKIRLDSFFDARPATVVGVLEPCVPYPMDTELIGNVVTSSHHLSAEMVTSRIHRMTEVFGRLRPGVSLDQARAELQTVYGNMVRQHADAYPAKAQFTINAIRLRDQLSSNARTILLVLLVASVLVFVIACCNVANLILARTVRRESEMAIRAALGASTRTLRKTLLAESLLLCGGGAALGMLIAWPMVSLLARYFSRYSPRALELSLEPEMLWVGAALALLAAVLLAFVPRLPSEAGPSGFALTSGSTRVTGTEGRRLRLFAVIQIAASFVLVASAVATVKTLMSLETAQTGFETRSVLAVDVPVMHVGRTPQQIVEYYRDAAERIRTLPGVRNVAVSSGVPWRDSSEFALQLSPDGHVPKSGEESPHAQVRVVSPGFFATLGLPVIEGRDFNDGDGERRELVAIITESAARQLFPKGDALNHYITWNDPILQAVPILPQKPQRIIGVVPDIDDTHVIPQRTIAVYHPFAQQAMLGGGRLLVHTGPNPYALVAPITHILQGMLAEQPVERPATLDDVRAQVLSTDRLNAMVFGVFAGVALLIAIVGVSGVLAFSVTGRTREFGIRLAVGSQPSRLLFGIVGEGLAMAIAGLVVGALCGYGLVQMAGNLLADVKTPGWWPLFGSAAVLLASAIAGSLLPAMRAARVDVIEALRID